MAREEGKVAMAEASAGSEVASRTFAERLLYVLAVAFVLAGLLNATPGIPGLDDGLRNLTGFDWITSRKFPREWFFPIIFALMMLIVALKHSMWRGLAREISPTPLVRALHGTSRWSSRQ